MKTSLVKLILTNNKTRIRIMTINISNLKILLLQYVENVIAIIF